MLGRVPDSTAGISEERYHNGFIQNRYNLHLDGSQTLANVTANAEIWAQNGTGGSGTLATSAGQGFWFYLGKVNSAGTGFIDDSLSQLVISNGTVSLSGAVQNIYRGGITTTLEGGVLITRGGAQSSFAQDGGDLIQGGAGNDTASYSDSERPVHIDLNAAVQGKKSLPDVVSFEAAGEVLSGLDGNSYIYLIQLSSGGWVLRHGPALPDGAYQLGQMNSDGVGLRTGHHDILSWQEIAAPATKLGKLGPDMLIWAERATSGSGWVIKAGVSLPNGAVKLGQMNSAGTKLLSGS